MSMQDRSAQDRSFLVRAPRIEPRLERPHEAAESSVAIVRRHPLPTRGSLRSGHGHISRHCSRVDAGWSVRHPAEPGSTDAEAKQFTEYALRLVLEVLNHKRIPAVLATLLDSAPQSLVRSLYRGSVILPGRGLGAARLHGVELRRVSHEDAEIYGTYVRGKRRFAIAGRITRRPRIGWRVTALQVG